MDTMCRTGYPATLRHLVKNGANLIDPELAKLVIMQQKKNGEALKDT